MEWLALDKGTATQAVLLGPQNTEIDRSSCTAAPFCDRCNVVSVAIECATLDATAFSADEYSLRRGRHYSFSPHSTACSHCEADRHCTARCALLFSANPLCPSTGILQRYQRGNRCMGSSANRGSAVPRARASSVNRILDASELYSGCLGVNFDMLRLQCQRPGSLIAGQWLR